MEIPNSARASQPESIPAAVQELRRENQLLAAEVQQLRSEIERARSEIEQVRRDSIPWRWITHPLFVLAASLGTALAAAAYIIVDNDLGVSPGRHGFYLYYMVPIAAPFAAFVLDRAARLGELHWTQWAIDLPVVILGLVRAMYALPGVSGHALFLTYALLTIRSRVAQVLTTIVLAEVIYLKLFAWGDLTLFGGMLVAGAAALLFHLLKKTIRR